MAANGTHNGGADRLSARYIRPPRTTDRPHRAFGTSHYNLPARGPHDPHTQVVSSLARWVGRALGSSSVGTGSSTSPNPSHGHILSHQTRSNCRGRARLAATWRKFWNRRARSARSALRTRTHKVDERDLPSRCRKASGRQQRRPCSEQYGAQQQSFLAAGQHWGRRTAGQHW